MKIREAIGLPLQLISLFHAAIIHADAGERPVSTTHISRAPQG